MADGNVMFSPGLERSYEPPTVIENKYPVYQVVLAVIVVVVIVLFAGMFYQKLTGDTFTCKDLIKGKIVEMETGETNKKERLNKPEQAAAESDSPAAMAKFGYNNRSTPEFKEDPTEDELFSTYHSNQ